MGPPGSGKTATLTKRLGQKLDLSLLDQEEDDTRLVRASIAGLEGHRTSWLMFSPTDLLKVYVKDAFNQEGILAPDDRIQTWATFRMELGRDHLRILRSVPGRGVFVLWPHLDIVQQEALERSIAWFEAFDSWQRRRFWADLREGAKRLAAQDDGSIRSTGQRLERLLAPGAAGTDPAVPVLLDVGGGLQDQLEAIGKHVDGIPRKAVNTALSCNKGFLDEFAAYLARVDDGTAAEQEEADETDEDENDEGDVAVAPSASAASAFAAYARTVKRAARAGGASATEARTPHGEDLGVVERTHPAAGRDGGAGSRDDLAWDFPDIDLREINITYRHSLRLNDFAREIAQALYSRAFRAFSNHQASWPAWVK
ncbi:hypothetical protein JYK14_02980 [Siccirubricoccus sp. KC 17139]|uniref:ATP-binding protein n=1 Tax=Siccirubricoccus soli TaxID=2899147 RepID=A0ABT1CZP9_9PROT|nr:hypothetical protein [Siccirubricoccus soli]MCO6415141.1 hypothetical protein [Siccirubricoccus soli]MCP2681272.1 hypothetical protein [Siccirubricoccus soli]